MLTFALGILSGKLFDAGWFHFVTMLGSILFGMGCAIFPDSSMVPI